MATIQKIISHLWFDTQAEEAVNFYTSIFRNSKVGKMTHYGKEGFEVHGMPEGTIMTIAFTIEGQDFVALNGGPIFKFNESVSFLVNCETQDEIDYYWERLKEGGDEKSQVCGWLKDKFGLSWQIVPRALADMVSDANQVRSQRVMKELLRMKKLDIATLEKAYNE